MTVAVTVDVSAMLAPPNAIMLDTGIDTGIGNVEADRSICQP